MTYVIAKRLILSHWLLVFDEIQLLDVSSANLLADVLSWFWQMGGVIVGTSNKVPEDLYKNGVQKERLGPFVDALKARCPIVSMQSKQDWRMVKGRTERNRTWFNWDQEEQFNVQLQSIIDVDKGVCLLY
jgi:protein AFG1